MKKFLSTAVLMLLILACAVSCSGKGNQNPSETTPSPNGSSTEESILNLVMNGKSEFRILYSKNESRSLFNYISNLQDTVIKYFTADISSAVANLKNYDENAYEILIGDTGYPESDACSTTLRASDWTVTVRGHKLVIVGGSTDSTQKAIYWFINNVVNVQGKNNSDALSFSAADTQTVKTGYPTDSILVDGTELRYFQIVLPREYTVLEHETAMMLRQKISDAYGFALEVGYDDQTYPNELRIGKTSRTSAAPGTCEYDISVAGGNIELIAGSSPAYDCAVDRFYNLFMSQKEVTISETHIAEDATQMLEANNDGIAGRLGDIRVIYQNIYGYAGSPDTNIRRRLEFESILYTEYDADVLCLQEFSAGAQTLRTRLTNAGYAEVKPQGVVTNYTPIFYRADRLELKDCGWLLYEGLNDVNSKSVTWALFKDLKSGKEVIICSTHFMYSAENNEARKSDARQLIALLDELESKYGVPVIFGGDLNCTDYSDPINILRENGCKSARDEAQKGDKVATSHSYPSYNPELGYYYAFAQASGGTTSIDHIFFRGDGLTIGRFQVMHHSLAMKTSDHCPLVLDFSID